MTFWKLDDCQMENTEMGGWLLCQYNMENLIKADRIDNQGRRSDLQKTQLFEGANNAARAWSLCQRWERETGVPGFPVTLK